MVDLTGAVLSANQACECGVLERVVETGESLNEAFTIAQEIASKDPLTIAKAKQVINQAMDLKLEEGQSIETQCFAELC